MSATGTEVVTLSQLKMLETAMGGAGGKKYKITKDSLMPEYVKTEASPGEVVVTSVVGYNDSRSFYVYEDVGDGSTGQIIEKGMTTGYIDELPEVVKQAVAEIPQMNVPVPEPSSDDYGWFIMPPCDVVLRI